ncbi:Rho termination factor N-terminal domain-containing protein [Trichothermofontia sp.]
MGRFDDIGKLMLLPLADIEPGEELSTPAFMLAAAAASLQHTPEQRNWVPIVVQEMGDYQYQVVSNHFVYAAANVADLDKVWCIVIDPHEGNIQQAKILSQEIVPKVNLRSASREIIEAALRYVMGQPGSPLKGIDLAKVTNRLEEIDKTCWTDLSPISTLKCGITKGKKLDALKQVFFLSPLAEGAKPERQTLQDLSTTELKKLAKEYGLAGYSKLKKIELVALLQSVPAIGA